MNEDECFQQLREDEINRLIQYGGSEEPIKGILTDDEILKYAGNSVSASRIRLKRGEGTFQDKENIHGDMLFVIEIFCWMVVMPCTGIVAFGMDVFIAKILFILFFILLFGYPLYVLVVKDYTEPQYKQTLDERETINNEKGSANDDLLLLFESKEKITREMIEKRFPAPQMTNSKFNGVLDKCREIVESQIEILNALTPTEKTKYEIDSRKKLIKQIIGKLDDLTNELILSEETSLEEVIEDMDNLINSVKDYE